MNKFFSSKAFSVLGILTLFSVFVTACNVPQMMTFGNPQNFSGTISICHAGGDADQPYTLVSVSAADLTDHSKHPDDIIPAPAATCPDVLVVGGNDGKITICHATNSASNPYNKITIALSGLNGHSKHAKDFIPASEDADCSTETATPTLTPTITATMDGTATVTATVTITPTPEATQIGDDGKKITICHATGSKKNRYVEITISVNGLNGHNKHSGDIIPAPSGGCPD